MKKTHFICLSVFVMSLFASASSVSACAPNMTPQSFQTLGGCTIGNLFFSNLSVSNGLGTTLPNVTISPITTQPFGLTFASPTAFDHTLNNIEMPVIFYVSTIDGVARINDIELLSAAAEEIGGIGADMLVCRGVGNNFSSGPACNGNSDFPRPLATGGMLSSGPLSLSFPAESFVALTVHINVGDVPLPSFDVRISQVPEPATLLLCGSGLLWLWKRRRWA